MNLEQIQQQMEKAERKHLSKYLLHNSEIFARNSSSECLGSGAEIKHTKNYVVRNKIIEEIKCVCNKQNRYYRTHSTSCYK